MENIKETVATQLRNYRKLSGLSAADAGTAIGKSRQAITSYEIGRTSPSLDDLVKLVELYNVPNISALFGMGSVNRLPESELRLLDTFRRLNEEGQIKVAEYAEDLANNFAYIKSHSDGVVDSQAREISRLK